MPHIRIPTFVVPVGVLPRTQYSVLRTSYLTLSISNCLCSHPGSIPHKGLPNAYELGSSSDQS